SAVDVIALTTITRWFSHNRGMMTGITKVGTGAGQFCLPLLASILILNYGWRNAFLVMGLLSSILLIIIASLLKRDPDDYASGHQKEQQKATVPEVQFTFRQSLHTIQFWIICLINMSILYCMMSILVHIVPHAMDLGIEQQYAASILSIIGAVSMAGRFVTGIAIDRIKSKKMLFVCFFVLMLSLLWLQTADSLWKLYVFACMYGLAHGSFFTIISPIVAEFFGIGFHGSLFGIVIFFGTVGGAIGPIMAGQIFDVTGSYTLAFWIISGIIIAGFALLRLLKPVAG
ncbi:MAG: MFS transporter, partial [Desulfobacterales bacterium]|nr:MFS transporter [Desulfobacterales bacterium]